MSESKKKKRGRPKGSTSKNPAKKSLSNVRVTDTQMESYKAASKRSGQTFSAWVRNELDKSASK